MKVISDSVHIKKTDLKHQKTSLWPAYHLRRLPVNLSQPNFPPHSSPSYTTDVFRISINGIWSGRWRCVAAAFPSSSLWLMNILLAAPRVRKVLVASGRKLFAICVIYVNYPVNSDFFGAPIPCYLNAFLNLLSGCIIRCAAAGNGRLS